MSVDFDITKVPFLKGMFIAISIVLSICPPLLITYKINPGFFLAADIWKLLLINISAGVLIVVLNVVIFIFIVMLTVPDLNDLQKERLVLHNSMSIPVIVIAISHMFSAFYIFLFDVTIKKAVISYVGVNICMLLLSYFILNKIGEDFNKRKVNPN